MLPEWEQLLAAERDLQHLGAVLVGGTTAAIHVGHRVSMDGDHVLQDLRERFDDVLRSLETAAGWETERVQRPVLILDQLDGIRIKAWLLATRHTVRDYLDTVVLCERLGDAGVRAAFATFDEIYRQAAAVSPLTEVVECLAAAAPIDLATIDLSSYRGLRPPWNDWAYLVARGRHWATVIARIALEPAS